MAFYFGMANTHQDGHATVDITDNALERIGFVRIRRILEAQRRKMLLQPPFKIGVCISYWRWTSFRRVDVMPDVLDVSRPCASGSQQGRLLNIRSHHSKTCRLT